MIRASVIAAALAVGGPACAEGFREFAGHGGPVMDVVVSAGGARMLTASFDNSVGVWDTGAETQPVWLDGHDAAVNCAVFLGTGFAASGGDDFAVILWDLDAGAMRHRLDGHRGKVMGLAGTDDGSRLASASWDGTIRIWDTSSGALVAELGDHGGPVNAVQFSGDGTRLFSASYDGTVVEWDTATWAPLRTLARHGFGVNVLTLNEAEGWIGYGALDGGTRVLDLGSGAELADLTAGRRPILALAQSDAGDRIAVGDGEGYIMVIETSAWRIIRDFKAALNGPVWALDFTGSGEGIVAAGIDDAALLWPLDGSDSDARIAEMRRAFHVNPDSVSNGERQFLRKCSICHTLGESGARRAGPPLAGLFGRRAGSVSDYRYSEAVQALDLVWTAETIDALFDVGPEVYIPGTKMPAQRIAAAEDRADLIEFLARETEVEVQR